MNANHKESFNELIDCLKWLSRNEDECMDLFGTTDIMEILYDEDIYDFVDEIQTERRAGSVFTEVSIGDVISLTDGKEIIIYRKFPLSKEIEGFDRDGMVVRELCAKVNKILDHIEEINCFLEK